MEIRIINANKFDLSESLRKEAETHSTGRKFRIYETPSSNEDGWRAIETSIDSGQNNYPGLEFIGPQPTWIEEILERCC
jgi:hypothetical protein